MDSSEKYQSKQFNTKLVEFGLLDYNTKINKVSTRAWKGVALTADLKAKGQEDLDNLTPEKLEVK